MHGNNTGVQPSVIQSADPVRGHQACEVMLVFSNLFGCVLWATFWIPPSPTPPSMPPSMLQLCLNKINSFIQKSGKVGFPQKSRIWWKFTYQNSLFTENLNGPYGPYEQLLWDISPNKWPKNRVFDENSLFWKMTMSKILGNAVFGQKKAPAGCPDSKTKVVNIFRNIPDPNYI